MSRAAVNAALENNGTLISHGLQAFQVFAANAYDTPSVFPFIVMRWEDAVPVFGRVATQGLTVWVHDQVGDYARISTLLEDIKDILTGMVHVAGADGWTVTQIDWRGDSPDLYDDGLGTITRNAGFSVVARRS